MAAPRKRKAVSVDRRPRWIEMTSQFIEEAVQAADDDAFPYCYVLDALKKAKGLADGEQYVLRMQLLSVNYPAPRKRLDSIGDDAFIEMIRDANST
jgi:hypothetical protein